MALPPNPHPFTFASARLECDPLDGNVTHALERQVNRHVVEFAMLVGVMTETKEGLQDVMESTICHVEDYYWSTMDADRTQAWVHNITASMQHGPDNYHLSRMFEAHCWHLVVRLSLGRMYKRMEEMTKLRERAFCIQRLVTELEDPPTGWYLHAQHIVEYLCSPDMVYSLGLEMPHDIPGLGEQTPPSDNEF